MAAGAAATNLGAAGGDLTGTYPSPTLGNAGGGAAGPIGDSTHVAAVTVDAKGRVTALSSVSIAAGGNVAYSARGSNTILAAGDKGNVIAATAAYTQTLTAAATLGAGWWCYLYNTTQDGTTVLTVDPNGSETIDGLTTITMYSGEMRIVECDGSNFNSQLVHGGFAKFTPTGGNFIVPAGIEELDVVCIGSGGQGGGGASAVSTAKSGGGGGGGGAVVRAIIRGSDVTAGATVTVTVGAGGSALGGGGTAGAGGNGSNGSNGAATSFGTLLQTVGGSGGLGGAAGGIGGGAGAPIITNLALSATAIAGQGSSAAGTNVAGLPSEWGGASGGGSPASAVTAKAGGGSVYGGPGGGGGGGVTVGNAGGNGQSGGSTQNYLNGGGASGGGGGASTVKGTDGVFTGPYCGQGGGGGGAGNADVAGKVGGIGGVGAGGGGGGASSSASSSPVGGAGGAGGAGECRVWYS
jgi:hypothetical protein